MIKRLLIALLLCAGATFAQSPPTSVIAPARAIDWSKAGVGALPTRSQCGSTITPASGSGNAVANGVTIRAAMASCNNMSENVVIASGTYYVDALCWNPVSSSVCSGQPLINNVSLVGAGPASTDLIFTTGTGCNGLGADVCMYGGGNNCAQCGGSPPSNGQETASWTAGYSVGTTSITLNSVNGSAPTMKQLLFLDQLDDSSDPGNVYYCQATGNPGCSQQGGVGNGRSGRSQSQVVTVTAISGSGTGPYTVTITPGLYASNWSGSKSPGAWWTGVAPITGDSIENMTLDHSMSSVTAYPGSGIMMSNASGNWVRNVRDINGNGPAVGKHVWLYLTAHNTVRDSYFYGSDGASNGYGVDSGYSSGDQLVENNICQHIASCTITEGDEGTVFGYNYAVDDFFSSSGTAPQWQQCDSYHHSVGDSFVLWEGQIGICHTSDSIHGSSDPLTMFRDYWNGRDPALTPSSTDCIGPSPCPKIYQTSPIALLAYSREQNCIGCVLGTLGYHTTYQQNSTSTTDNGNAGVANTSIYVLGYSGSISVCGYYSTGCSGSSVSVLDDSLVLSELYRWGNCEPSTGSWVCHFNATEVPSAIGAPYTQPVPSSHTLPNSFYLPSNGASPPAFWHTPSGNPPWPNCGPDITGGNIPNTGGLCNYSPAANCYLSVMGGLTNGSSGVLSFDANACYPAGSGTPAITFALTNGGSSITSFNFGSVAVGSGSAIQTFYVENTGTAPVVITLPVSNVGGNTGDFAYISNPCASGGGTIAVGSFCTIQMQFSPTLVGAESTTMTFNTNVSGSPQTIALSGTGTGSPPPNPGGTTPSYPTNIEIQIASNGENK